MADNPTMSTITEDSVQKFQYAHTINSSGTHTKQLQTAGKIIDKDIILSITTPSASPSFDGGALNNKDASATFINMSTSQLDTSGVGIQTTGTAGRDAVLYDGAVAGWVDKSDNDQALASASASTWNGNGYYATGVAVPNNKAFDVVVPNGEGTATFHFAVDSSGNVVITNPQTLPSVTPQDDGKVLKVVNGAWTVAASNS